MPRGIAYLRLLPLLLAIATACTKRNPGYCDEELSCIDPARPFCDLTGAFGDNGINACIANPFSECVTDSECPSNAPFCDESAGGCRPCFPDDTGDIECAAINSATPICSDNRECVVCRANADCSLAAPICSDGQCTPCTEIGERSLACEEQDVAFPFCVGDGRCSGCIESSTCTTANPVCDVLLGACRGCQEHSECESTICNRTSGECVPEEDILFVDRAGDPLSADGARSSPYPNIVDALAHTPPKLYIKIFPGTYDEQLTPSGANRVLIGEEDVIIRSMGAPLSVTTGTRIVVEELRLVGVDDLPSTAVGIICDGGEVVARRIDTLATTGAFILGACQATLVEYTVVSSAVSAIDASENASVTIRDSSISNASIGVSVRQNATLSVTNTEFIANNDAISFDGAFLDVSRCRIRNGVGSSGFGNGIRIAAGTANVTVENTEFVENAGVGLLVEGSQSGYTFQFNTFFGNTIAGSDCQGGSPAAVHENSIFFGNGMDLAGGCAARFSLLQTATSGTNINGDPSFVDALNRDFRLMMGSPAIDAADTGATIETDIDGITRPQGSAPDMGAHEFVPTAMN